MNDEAVTIFDFSKDADGEPWRSIGDVVMGGVSTCTFSVTPDGIGVFQGVLSLEQGGGFASVRSRPERLDLSKHHGLEIRVRGDGKRYRLRLHTDPPLDGVAYQVAFDTQAGIWESMWFPFEHFRPTYRGRTIAGAPPLDSSRIVSFGWMIADGQAGPFRLAVDWVRAYSEVAD